METPGTYLADLDEDISGEKLLPGKASSKRQDSLDGSRMAVEVLGVLGLSILLVWLVKPVIRND